MAGDAPAEADEEVALIPFEVSSSADDLKVVYAFYLGATIVGVSILAFALTLPLFLFSHDKLQRERAGGIVKTTLYFLVFSGEGVMAFLGFVVR